jgi:sporulation protein YlmC with PRC-barrel domain
MELRYHQIVGSHVLTADGHRVGRIADLVAEPRDGRLHVVGLLVGPSGLIRRIFVAGRPTGEIPWSLVASIGHHVRLRVTRDEFQRRESAASDGEPA